MSQRGLYLLIVCLLSVLLLVAAGRAATMIYSYSVGYQNFEGKVILAKCRDSFTSRGSDHVEVQIQSERVQKKFTYTLDCSKFRLNEVQGRHATVKYDHLGEVIALAYDGVQEISQSWAIRARILSFIVVIPTLGFFLCFCLKKYRSTGA